MSFCDSERLDYFITSWFFFPLKILLNQIFFSSAFSSYFFPLPNRAEVLMSLVSPYVLGLNVKQDIMILISQICDDASHLQDRIIWVLLYMYLKFDKYLKNHWCSLSCCLISQGLWRTYMQRREMFMANKFCYCRRVHVC